MDAISIAGKNSKRIYLGWISMKDIGGSNDTNGMQYFCMFFYYRQTADVFGRHQEGCPCDRRIGLYRYQIPCHPHTCYHGFPILSIV